MDKNLTPIEQDAEKLVNPRTFDQFMTRVRLCYSLERRFKAQSTAEIELIQMAQGNFKFYQQMTNLSHTLKTEEIIGDQVFKRFGEFKKKCFARVWGGPGALDKKQHRKKSFILCDNLQDCEEEVLDINNYLYMLWLKMKHCPAYLVYEQTRSDYRKE
jgi:hypothetical protein